RSHRSVVSLLIFALASAAHAQTAAVPDSGPTNKGAARAFAPTARSSWQAQLGEDLRRQEYWFQPVPGEEGVWSAPSRAHELRCRVSREGPEVFPRKQTARG